MFFPLKKILNFHINKLGLRRKQEKQELFLIWEEAVSNCQPLLKNKAKPLNLTYKTLIIDCLNAALACEFQLFSAQLIKEVNRRLKKRTIEKIKFVY